MSACTMVANDPRFPGPAALNRLFTVVSDSRDGGHPDRAAVLLSEDTLMRCHSQANCTDVCPMEISPTESILALRRRAVRGLFGER
jgi:succinate dehydrogenase/fumarate reductase-like Fe-S protein